MRSGQHQVDGPDSQIIRRAAEAAAGSGVRWVGTCRLLGAQHLTGAHLEHDLARLHGRLGSLAHLHTWDRVRPSATVPGGDKCG